MSLNSQIDAMPVDIQIQGSTLLDYARQGIKHPLYLQAQGEKTK
jgi:hypothetical protein